METVCRDYLLSIDQIERRKVYGRKENLSGERLLDSQTEPGIFCFMVRTMTLQKKGDDPVGPAVQQLREESTTEGLHR